MTYQEINEAIAQACGFVGSDKWGHWYKTTSGIVRDCPDYCNDLNEMHEAESALRLPVKQSWDAWEDYCRILEDDPHATARQRAEAFLRTIGKWRTE